MRPCVASHDKALATMHELEGWAAECCLELDFLTMRQDLIKHELCKLKGCWDMSAMERDRVGGCGVYNHEHSSCSCFHITCHYTPCLCCHPRLNKDLTPRKMLIVTSSHPFCRLVACSPPCSALAASATSLANTVLTLVSTALVTAPLPTAA